MTKVENDTTQSRICSWRSSNKRPETYPLLPPVVARHGLADLSLKIFQQRRRQLILRANARECSKLREDYSEPARSNSCWRRTSTPVAFTSSIVFVTSFRTASEVPASFLNMPRTNRSSVDGVTMLPQEGCVFVDERRVRFPVPLLHDVCDEIDNDGAVALSLRRDTHREVTN